MLSAFLKIFSPHLAWFFPTGGCVSPVGLMELGGLKLLSVSVGGRGRVGAGRVLGAKSIQSSFPRDSEPSCGEFHPKKLGVHGRTRIVGSGEEGRGKPGKVGMSLVSPGHPPAPLLPQECGEVPGNAGKCPLLCQAKATVSPRCPQNYCCHRAPQPPVGITHWCPHGVPAWGCRVPTSTCSIPGQHPGKGQHSVKSGEIQFYVLQSEE